LPIVSRLRIDPKTTKSNGFYSQLLIQKGLKKFMKKYRREFLKWWRRRSRLKLKLKSSNLTTLNNIR